MFFRKIDPVGIVLFDDVELPLAGPAFDRLFASDGILDIVMRFEPHEAFDVALARVTAEGVGAVLVNPRKEI